MTFNAGNAKGTNHCFMGDLNRLNCFPTDTHKDTYVRKGNPDINRGSPMTSHNQTCTITQLVFCPAGNIMETQLDTHEREIPVILVILSFVCSCIIVQLGVYPAPK